MQLTPSDVALVTGAASGLGRATASALVRAGVRVVLVDLPGTTGEQAAHELGDRAVFAPADVTDESAVADAVAVAAGLGELRVTVTCAGIASATRTVGRRGAHPLADFRRVVEVNLIGTFNVVRLAAEAMSTVEARGEERGVVVMTASIAAFDGQIGQTAYSASKGGIVGLTLPLARDLADFGIRVVTIAPGIFETPLMAAASDEVRASLAAQVPHPARFGRPAEYADLVTSIVANPMLNGETIRLDGAVRMGPR
jgi:NAD(P)-dependent dehydrogenase (short-subunit alcohol dehydrogenase family)